MLISYASTNISNTIATARFSFDNEAMRLLNAIYIPFDCVLSLTLSTIVARKILLEQSKVDHKKGVVQARRQPRRSRKEPQIRSDPATVGSGLL